MITPGVYCAHRRWARRNSQIVFVGWSDALFLLGYRGGTRDQGSLTPSVCGTEQLTQNGQTTGLRPELLVKGRSRNLASLEKLITSTTGELAHLCIAWLRKALS